MTLLRRAPYWISLPAAVGLAIWLSLAGPERAFSVPINESSGALHYMAQAKATLDHGWWWTNPSLSAPSSLHAAVLPRVSSVDHTILLAVGLFTSEVASAVNIAWLVMLMLGGVSTAWCLRRLGSSSWAAWVAGALFGLCPFALYYNISEPSLMPYLVPFAATAALALATNRWAEWPRRDRRVVLAGCVLLGSNGLDLAYFGTWLTAIGAIAGAVWVRSRARLAQGSAVPALIVLAVTVSLLPMMVARQQEGYSVDEHFLIGETERSGLKIRQLLGPLPEHWLPFIRKWSAREGEARFPYESENQYARLGIVAGVGFIGLVAALLLPSVAGSSPHGDTIRSASRLTFALLLLATVGGFGALIGLFISPRVYIYSRAYASCCGWSSSYLESRISGCLLRDLRQGRRASRRTGRGFVTSWLSSRRGCPTARWSTSCRFGPIRAIQASSGWVSTRISGRIWCRTSCAGAIPHSRRANRSSSETFSSGPSASGRPFSRRLVSLLC